MAPSPPKISGFIVVPMDSLPKSKRSRSWPDHAWHATHREDDQIMVTAATPEQLQAACDGVRLLSSWRLTLEAVDKQPSTIESYFIAARTLIVYLADRGLPTDVTEITTDHVRQFLRDWKERTSSARASFMYRGLHVFFAWCVKDGEIGAPSPMDRIERVNPKRKAYPVFSEEDLRALVNACQGNDFESRRDLAIIRILMDNGVRVGGLAGLRYSEDDEKANDVFVRRHQLRVVLKGGREFMAPIGKKAAAALDRYLRERNKHLCRESPWLWLPVRSPSASGAGEARLTADGIRQMIGRRAEQAGIDAHPHKFRRTMASTWDGDTMLLMRVGGWESVEMVRMYAESGEQRKAHEAHRKFSPGDKI